jgi:hypothetical protein
MEQADRLSLARAEQRYAKSLVPGPVIGKTNPIPYRGLNVQKQSQFGNRERRIGNPRALFAQAAQVVKQSQFRSLLPIFKNKANLETSQCPHPTRVMTKQSQFARVLSMFRNKADFPGCPPAWIIDRRLRRLKPNAAYSSHNRNVCASCGADALVEARACLREERGTRASRADQGLPHDLCLAALGLQASRVRTVEARLLRVERGPGGPRRSSLPPMCHARSLLTRTLAPLYTPGTHETAEAG